MSTILLSVLALGGMGLLFGVGLSYAGIMFKVEEDPRLGEIKDALPGANCGGCGYAGCAALAEAILAGTAAPNACPVGGEASAKAIGAILGVEVTVQERQCAFVKCGGDRNKSSFRYTYQGLNSCGAAMQLAAGGAKNCAYGCLGGGSCEAVCAFGAISMVNGIALVDNEKCTACGKCVKECPKKIIELAPYKNKTRVACSSRDNGKTVRANCTVGCIACKICEKNCEYGAVHVNELLAAVDYEKCTQCNVCAEKCPMKCIVK
ncbi:MAG: RnfABCDGE type electron transport complex subunit B [Clostridiales bacterium]|jgi:Na+-translocating ferredoxin:NAD+ oxidoreductase RNF subunit RnfB|nr:RnfABCDGE type electron transport complex subunit B [Clostridiales bacterium]